MESMEELIQRHPLAYLEDEVMTVAKRSIRLVNPRTWEHDLPIGCSKMGGIPDLPSSFEFPTYQGRSLAFLAQLNLEQLAVYDYEKLMPTHGMLYFFYDAEHQPTGRNPYEKDAWRVLYYDGHVEDLTPRPFPADVAAHCYFDPIRIRFRQEYSFPNFDYDEYAYLPLHHAADEDQYAHLTYQIERFYDGEFVEARHKMFGYPDSIQSNAFDAVEDNPIMLEGIQRPNEWILLLQIDSDDESAMWWGDQGMIYFCIKKDDLLQRKFDQVRLTLQCE